MNEHAVNAFVRFTETHESLAPCLELTGLACAVLSKLARYFGWENWVFGSATWRFYAKSLVPNGLVKVPPAYLPDPFPAPTNLYSGLDEVGVNLLQFCAVASREPDLLVLMLGRRISALPRADT